MKRKILNKNFFRKPTLEVAKNLLGKILVRKIGKKEIIGIITEVEAYDGPEDKASHASRGMTKRNSPMFDAGGYFYIYLCYGMYEMLNFVTGPKDYPAAILIRGAIIPLLGGERGWSSPLLFKSLSRVCRGKGMGVVKNSPLGRGVSSRETGRVSPLLFKEGMGVVLDGPGKLTKYFKITRDFNKKEINPKSGLWVEDWGIKIDEKKIKKMPRIGVAYAGPIWSKKPYRFIINF